MTAEELRRLAEIAGVEVKYSDFEGCFLYEENYAWFSWQPHLRIEQAMIVADAFVEWELRKTSEKRYYSFVVSDDLENYYDATEDTASLSLCRAALAAKE